MLESNPKATDPTGVFRKATDRFMRQQNTLRGGSKINSPVVDGAPNRVDSQRLSDYAASFLAAFASTEIAGQATIKAVSIVLSKAKTTDDLVQIHAALAMMTAVLRRPMSAAETWMIRSES